MVVSRRSPPPAADLRSVRAAIPDSITVGLPTYHELGLHIALRTELRAVAGHAVRPTPILHRATFGRRRVRESVYLATIRRRGRQLRCLRSTSENGRESCCDLGGTTRALRTRASRGWSSESRRDNECHEENQVLQHGYIPFQFFELKISPESSRENPRKVRVTR